MRVAAIIVNYNMPERAGDLARYFLRHVSGTSVHLVLVDNGSDKSMASGYTTLYLKNNVQTTRGWIEGLKSVKSNLWKVDYYWFLITSAEFVGDEDILTPMVRFMDENTGAVAIHPSLTKDSTSAWKHLINRETGKVRRTWMIDNIASLYRADWFDSIGGFDPALVYAWGIDLETCWKARRDNRSIWVDDRVQIKKVTNIGYTMDRMGMTADERTRLAIQNTDAVFTPRYGRAWRQKLMHEYVTKEML